MISKRLQQLQPSPTLRLDAQVKQLQSEGRHIINLGLGEPDFITPLQIRRAAITAILEGFTHYTITAGIPPLREAICKKFERDNGIKYIPSEIVVGVGTSNSFIMHSKRSVMKAMRCIPPEFIGMGRGIRYAISAGKIPLLEKYYVGVKSDLKRAGGFLYKDGLKKLAKKSFAWHAVLEDVSVIEKYLGIKLGPKTAEEKEHCRIVAEVHKKLESGLPIAQYLPKLASLRKSIG